MVGITREGKAARRIWHHDADRAGPSALTRRAGGIGARATVPW